MYGLENRSVPISLGGAVALCAVLFGTTPAFAESGRWYTQEQVERGAAVFAQHCAACHGANAEATPNWRETSPEGKYPPPPLNGTAHAWHHPLDVLRRQIRLGGVPLGGSMPAFKDTLSAADIDAVIAFFQSKWNDEIYAAWQERGGRGDALVRTVEAAAEETATRHLRRRFPKADIGAPEATPVENIVLVKASDAHTRYRNVGSAEAAYGSCLWYAGARGYRLTSRPRWDGVPLLQRAPSGEIPRRARSLRHEEGIGGFDGTSGTRHLLRAPGPGAADGIAFERGKLHLPHAPGGSARRTRGAARSAAWPLNRKRFRFPGHVSSTPARCISRSSATIPVDAPSAAWHWSHAP